MKKLILYCLLAAVFLSGCGAETGNKVKPSKRDNSSVTSTVDSSEVSSISDDNNSTEASTGDDYNDASQLAGSLSVSVNVKKADKTKKEILPTENTADLLNPKIAVMGGANTEAKTLRNKIRNAKDSITPGGNVYYVSANGTDENDGRSSAKAFKSISAAINIAEKGDTILIERGSVFRLSQGLTLQNGVKYGAYGNGPKPEIWGSPENYANYGIWSPHDIKNIWKMNYSRSDVGLIVFDHGKLAGNMKYYIRDLKKDGDFYFDETKKTLYIYNSGGNPGKTYSDIEIGSRNVLFRIKDGGSDIQIDNLAFRYTGTFAIRGSAGCRNIKITNCEIGWIDGSLFDDGSNRYGNGIEFTYGCQDITVENCWIYQIYDAGFTFQISGDEDVRYHTFKNIAVKNNLFEYCSWPYEWWIASNTHIVQNISISNNIMRYTGYGFAGYERHPAHIRGPWEIIPIKTENFSVDNNIFDCVNGSLYAWTLPYDTQPGMTISRNSYYQRKATSPENAPFMALCKENQGKYAANQSELETAVACMDANPKLVKWLK